MHARTYIHAQTCVGTNTSTSDISHSATILQVGTQSLARPCPSLNDRNVTSSPAGRSDRHAKCFNRNEAARRIQEVRQFAELKAYGELLHQKGTFMQKIFHEIRTPCHAQRWALCRWKVIRQGIMSGNSLSFRQCCKIKFIIFIIYCIYFHISPRSFFKGCDPERLGGWPSLAHPLGGGI